MKSRLSSCLTNALVLGWKAQLVKYVKLDCATGLTALISILLWNPDLTNFNTPATCRQQNLQHHYIHIKHLFLSILIPPLLFLVRCLFYKHSTPSPLHLHGSREDMQEHMAHHFHSACRGWALLGISTPLSSLLLCSVWQQLLLSIQSPFPLSLYVPKWPRTYWTYTASVSSWLIFCLPRCPIFRKKVRNNNKATPFKTNNQSVHASRAVWMLLCCLMKGWTWNFTKKCWLQWQLDDWLV